MPGFPTYITSSSVSGSAVTTIDIPAVQCINGDVLIAAIYTEIGTTPVSTSPAGFSTLATVINGAVFRLTVFAKTASNETRVAYNFQASGASWLGGFITVYRGGIVGVVGAGDVATSTTPTASAITTTRACKVLYIEANHAGGASTPPSGMTERVDVNAGTLAEVEQYAAGSTGSKAGTIASSEWAAVLVELQAVTGPSFLSISRRPAPFKPGLAR